MEGAEAVSVWLWKEHSMMLRTMIMMLSSPCVCLRLCGSEGFSFLLRTHFFFLLFLPSPFSLLWVYFLFLSIFSFRFSGFASTHDDPGCRGRARRMNTSTTPALVGLESMIPAKGDQNKKKKCKLEFWYSCGVFVDPSVSTHHPSGVQQCLNYISRMMHAGTMCIFMCHLWRRHAVPASIPKKVRTLASRHINRHSSWGTHTMTVWQDWLYLCFIL